VNKEQRVRVAHVIETLGTGGAEVLLAEVVSRLDSNRFCSRVFPLDGPLDLLPRFVRAGVEVDPVLLSPRRRTVNCLWRLAWKIRAFAPTIVHTHLYYGNVLGRIAARLVGARVVTTLHNPDYTFEARSTQLFALRKFLDRTTGACNAALLAVSEAVAKDYRAHMGWSGIRVLRNGVDVDRFCPGEGLRTAQFWPERTFRVLSIGRLHPQKGHLILIQALARCCAKGVDASAVIVGEGPLRERLVEEAVRLNVEGRVRLVGLQADVCDFLRAADVFVFPSLYEAVGISLLEAMACKKAVLASNVGGISEIVEDGISGVLVPPGDVESLADALIRLEHESFNRALLGQAARARVMKFDIRTTVRELESLYAELEPALA
jgi:glycosyltransferase involved in cell wall biosynthesis